MTERTAILSRMFLVFGLLLLIPFALAFQLIRINYLNGEELRVLWSKQAIDTIPIPAQRGNIYDSHGTLLATNSADYLIALDPKIEGITSAQINELTVKLGALTNRPAEFYRNKIKEAPSRSRYVVLARNQSRTVRDEIKALEIKGVILEENFVRRYTFETLAAHTLGYVNREMSGRIGLEAYYEDKLKGKDGVQQVRRDPFNRISAYVGAPKSTPQNGHSLHTTIDSYIQAILEDELESGVKKHLAEYGVGIIIEPKTGAIKALANYPTFDPNFPGSDEDENRRNFAISDMIEPGSTFKLVTVIAAVEQGVIKKGEIFETPENGEINLFGLSLRDHDPLGNMTFEQVIQKSSNISTAEIAMRMKPQVFYQYARNIGFGSATNVDLSGEVAGRLAKPYDWSKVSLPWLAHGYEVLATPLQVAQAYAAFANEGMLMRPYIVDRIEDDQGNVIQQTEPTEIRRIADKKTISSLVPIFESVVSDSGTGDTAQIEGLAIAGKTGTSKKFINGRYENRYVASFVGFFPAENPKYVCLILMNEPKTSGYGGVTAAPVFRETAKRIAGLDNDIQRSIKKEDLKPDYFAKVPSLVGYEKSKASKFLDDLNIPRNYEGSQGFVVSQLPAAGDTLKAGEKIKLILSETIAQNATNTEENSLISVPELRGMNMRTAENLLKDLNLESSIIGSGTIFAQYPKAGDKMRPGSSVTIRGKAKSLETITNSVSPTNN